MLCCVGLGESNVMNQWMNVSNSKICFSREPVPQSVHIWSGRLYCFVVLGKQLALKIYERTLLVLYLIPLQVDVPEDRILLGAKGSTSSRFIMKLAREAVRQVILISDWLRGWGWSRDLNTDLWLVNTLQDLLGIMVWYCSVQNGLKYAETWDTTGREDSMAGFVEAMDLFKNA